MSHKIPVPSKNELETFYHTHKSISKTARHFSTSNPTVRKWLQSYGISLFTHLEASLADTEAKRVSIPSKEELEFMYCNNSIKQLELLYSVGQNTIYQWLNNYGIESISISEKVTTAKQKSFQSKFGFDKETIEKDYEDVQCMGGLAEKYNCSMTTIKKLFRIHNIEAKFAKSSVGQLQVASYIESLGFTIIMNDRKLIAPLELDIIIPEKHIAIEYCGIYFHSETWGNKDRNYHLRKYDLCKEKGYKLITIFENEWFNKKDIIKSILATKLSMNTYKIPARKTTFKEITYSDIKQFEIDNHLQGTRPANRYYGLYHENDLVMSISIGKSRYNKNITNEIVRMTTKKNVIVVGGISKLIQHIGLSDCLTYADKRYGDGIGYSKVGFVKMKDSSPNYFYFHKKDHDTLHSRNKFQKHKIPNVDMSKSEYENMLAQDYDRIWDCGNSVYYYK